MLQPLVSIIIPYYSHADFLKEAVQSALAQQNARVEVVVVDDASPSEPAAELLGKFPDDRVKILRHEKNQGASAARNTAARHAKGAFLLPLDSDDLLEANYIEQTLPLLLEDTSLGGVYTSVKSFGSNEQIYDAEWTVEGILTGRAGALVCMLYRRQIFDQLDGYDTRWRVGEDSDFFLRACKLGWKFVRVAQPLYLYRRHGNATTSADHAADLTEMQMNLLTYHADLCHEHIREIVAFKDARYWKLQAEYNHLHQEFHKLLKLYTNLENAVSNNASDTRQASILKRVKKRVERVFSRLSSTEESE